MKNILEGLIDEIIRVARLLHYYAEFPQGKIAHSLILADLTSARDAIANEDLPKMLEMYRILKEVDV